MTTELVLLLSIFAFVVLGAFLGEKGPLATFKDASPRLGARVERDMSSGYQFHKDSKGNSVTWKAPPGVK